MKIFKCNSSKPEVPKVPTTWLWSQMFNGQAPEGVYEPHGWTMNTNILFIVLKEYGINGSTVLRYDGDTLSPVRESRFVEQDFEWLPNRQICFEPKEVK